MYASPIPQLLKSEIAVNLNLPPELLQLMRDAHADRDGIAVGGMILIACVVLCTLKKILTKG